ncbi:hypothetical protein [Acinetobacter nosocomialis]|uniref:hypothetical protein n=1 Tax=Acinetobacter nosocomialis TaxID=106654 RepID=UPI002A3585F5|nr:hypothetical protein [Acinetobacter nosocomialis]
MNNDREAIINASRGAVNMLIIDQPVYKNAIATETNKVTKALLVTTLEKVGVLKGLEKQIGNGYMVEESLSLGKLNQLCWTTKFLLHYKKDIPQEAQAAYSDVYSWIDAKQTAWTKKLNSAYTKDELGEDDCRK